MKPSQNLTQSFSRRINTLENTRKKIEALHTNRTISQKILEQTYAGLYLSAYTSFEGFVEDLFIGLLVDGKGFTQQNVHVRASINTHKIARELVFAGQPYLDWLPFDKTEKRAAMFFRSGKPFSNLEGQYKQILKQNQYIRNVIAHESEHSSTQFLKHVIRDQKFSSREKKPIGYLRAFHTSSVPTKYEYHVKTLVLIARILTK